MTTHQHECKHYRRPRMMYTYSDDNPIAKIASLDKYEIDGYDEETRTIIGVNPIPVKDSISIYDCNIYEGCNLLKSIRRQLEERHPSMFSEKESEPKSEGAEIDENNNDMKKGKRQEQQEQQQEEEGQKQRCRWECVDVIQCTGRVDLLIGVILEGNNVERLVIENEAGGFDNYDEGKNDLILSSLFQHVCLPNNNTTLNGLELCYFTFTTELIKSLEGTFREYIHTNTNDNSSVHNNNNNTIKEIGLYSSIFPMKDESNQSYMSLSIFLKNRSFFPLLETFALFHCSYGNYHLSDIQTSEFLTPLLVPTLATATANATTGTLKRLTVQLKEEVPTQTLSVIARWLRQHAESSSSCQLQLIQGSLKSSRTAVPLSLGDEFLNFLSTTSSSPSSAPDSLERFRIYFTDMSIDEFAKLTNALRRRICQRQAEGQEEEPAERQEQRRRKQNLKFLDFQNNNLSMYSQSIANLFNFIGTQFFADEYFSGVLPISATCPKADVGSWAAQGVNFGGCHHDLVLARFFVFF